MSMVSFLTSSYVTWDMILKALNTGLYGGHDTVWCTNIYTVMLYTQNFSEWPHDTLEPFEGPKAHTLIV